MPEYRSKALELRKLGHTYTEIAATVPVSKATLSKWLKDVEVPDSYYEKIKALKTKAREVGWEARRKDRTDRIAAIRTEAVAEVKDLALNPLWLVGLTLYWAEGTKEKAWGKGVLITFTNMDANSIAIFKNWCEKFLSIGANDFTYSIYIHDSRKSESELFAVWWASQLNLQPSNIRVYYKKSNISHVRRNDADEYHGVFRLQVRKSVDLNRKIAAWTDLLIESLKG